MSHQQAESGATARCDPATQQLSQQEEEVQRQAAALDDAVDTCEAQMSYLDSSIAKCKAVSLKDVAVQLHAFVEDVVLPR